MAKRVLTVDRWTRVTGKGDDREVERFTKGDVIDLTAAEIEHLGDSVEEPGASQKAEAQRLEAEVDRLKAQQEQIEAQVDEAEQGAKRVASGKSADDDGLESLTVAELRVEADAAGVADPPERKADLVASIREARAE